MKMKSYLITMILIFLLLTGCSKNSSNPVGNTDGASNSQTIDNVNAANGDISATIDKNNKIHVVYNSFNIGIKYATNKTGSWVTTMIHAEDSTMYMTTYNDIAVDSSGFVHIVYTTSWMVVTGEAAVYYATNKTGSWVKTKLAYAIGADFSGCGLAVTSAGKVHIVYGDNTMHLMYKNNLSGSWTGAGNLGTYWTSVRPRLALDASDNVYVAYEHGGEGTLHLQVINSTGSLVSNSIIDGVVSSGNSIGWSPDIAINKTNGNVIIPYWNYTGDLLRVYNGGAITTLDTLTNWTDPSIRTDISGKAHMCYTGLSTNELYYASNKTGAWVKEKLPVSVISRSSDLVIESTGKIDFIYCVKGANALKIVSK
jgi:hypothetical protein